jgi:hypothetical protein
VDTKKGLLTPKTKLMNRDNVTSRNSWYKTADPMIAVNQLRSPLNQLDLPDSEKNTN